MTEEVALLLAALVACGLLVLGTLELIWPTRPRRAARPAARPSAPSGPAAPVAAPEPPSRPEISPVEDRASVALRVARTLLERAQEEPNPASDRRLTMICRAIACLDRGLEAAPDDGRLRETLAAAQGALAKADQQAARRRLAAGMPWRTPAFAHAVPAASSR